MEARSLNRHQRRKIRTRKQLEQAAKELVIEKGYDDVTIQDIVDRADLGRGTFYLHFQDKEEAIWSLIEREIHEEKVLVHHFATEQPGVVTLQAAFANIFRHADQHRDLYTVMLGSKGSSALTNRVQDWLADDFYQEIEHFSLTQNHKSVPLNIVAQIITGALTRLIMWWLNTDNPYSADQMAALFYQSLANGMALEAP
ncbi:MAG: TetR/AcrR family transcriptional regulator [Anaerolineae bacterium]|jgi:AcrR family transcriptional regulator|nr:TetR/AcrR family transcriptional regulator [Anaerolineae bacterium]